MASFTFEIYSGEPSPLVAIRYILHKKLKDDIGNITLRLGTTHGTNALLERKGAKVLFVTTKGFKDILKIGDQNRPRLFDLNIKKAEVLHNQVLEVNERINFKGEIETEIDEKALAEKIKHCLEKNPKLISLAICFLNSYKNQKHEEIAYKIAN